MESRNRVAEALRRLPNLSKLQQYIEQEPEIILERAFPVEEPLFRNAMLASSASGPEALKSDSIQSRILQQSAELVDMGMRAVKKVQHSGADTTLDSIEVSGLEALVLLVGRPAILIQNGQFFPPPQGWEILEQYRTAIESVFSSVGRIELTGHPSKDWVGTGFLVAEDVVMTNRHVAVEFSRQEQLGKWIFEPGVAACINYTEELNSNQSAEFELTDIIGIHDTFDLALFRTEPISRQGGYAAKPLIVAADLPINICNRIAYVVGFPAWDGHRNDPDEIRRIFMNIFNIKRLQPGVITGVKEAQPLLTHDCSTLGGNSGSCLVDLELGKVVGLHFSGRYLQTNYAVALWKLRKDPLIKKGKIQFG
ncbi:serine protease [Scytonema sp. UIC 10036]|uniref:trypsin-like serine peptidase n=1 Tax=Scytonema sp. UIC 10036 TaxID=2304196 RepID=UPI0012DA7111|nr:serine protease [Scytonema sp. UIC 10036]MUG91717.1 serine protease [Scytonema sp. UIC 10036]